MIRVGGSMRQFHMEQETVTSRAIARMMMEKIVLFTRQIQDSNAEAYERWSQTGAVLSNDAFIKAYAHTDSMKEFLQHLVWFAMVTSLPADPLKSGEEIMAQTIKRQTKEIAEFEFLLLTAHRSKLGSDEQIAHALSKGKRIKVQPGEWCKNLFDIIPRRSVVGRLHLTPDIQVPIDRPTYDAAVALNYPVELN